MNVQSKNRFLLSTLIVLIIFWFPLGLLKTSSPGSFPHYIDKVIHFLVCLLWAFTNRNNFSSLKLLITAHLILALTTEVGQIAIPMRSFELSDILFDVLGLVPVIAYLKLMKVSFKN